MRFTLPVVVLLSAVALAAPAPLPLDSAVQTILLDSPAAPPVVDAAHINLAQRVSNVIAKFQRSIKSSSSAGATKTLKKKSSYVDYAAGLSRARVARNQVSARPGPSARASAAAAAGGPSARVGPSAQASASAQAASGPSAHPSARPSANASARAAAQAGPSARASAGPSASAAASAAAASQQAFKRELFFDAESIKNAPWESLDDSLLCPAGESACPIFPRNSSYECVDTEYELTSCGGCSSIGEGVDCTAIQGAQGVTCSAGTCLVFSCQSSFSLVADKDGANSCQKSV